MSELRKQRAAQAHARKKQATLQAILEYFAEQILLDSNPSDLYTVIEENAANHLGLNRATVAKRFRKAIEELSLLEDYQRGGKPDAWRIASRLGVPTSWVLKKLGREKPDLKEKKTKKQRGRATGRKSQKADPNSL